MWHSLKQWIKALPIPITRNQRYDHQTRQVIRRVCRPDSTCIDIGCHKGEVLEIMRQAAPEGHHFGFEPIPEAELDDALLAVRAHEAAAGLDVGARCFLRRSTG